MNILHVNMSIDPVNGGGTVERFLQLHKALSNQGIESQHILTISSPESNCENVPANEVTALPCLIKRWYLPVPKMATVRKLVEWADVIHLMNHWTFINAWVYLLARKLGKPYIVCPAGALTVFGRSKVKKYLYNLLVGKNIVRNALAGIAVSPHEVVHMEKSGLNSQAIFHIPNGVNDRDFVSVNASLFRVTFGIGSAPYILFVGRLNAIKGPDLLLNAVEKLKDILPHHLVFVGPDGGMGSQLKQQVIDSDLTNRVHFTGYLGGDSKSNAYHGAELLAVPSRHEAMSIVALEAAITGTPVLLTDQCGFSSLAAAGAALEVPATVNGLSEGLEQMLVDDGCDLEEMGKCGRAFALEHYSWATIAKRFAKLFNLIK